MSEAFWHNDDFIQVAYLEIAKVQDVTDVANAAVKLIKNVPFEAITPELWRAVQMGAPALEELVKMNYDMLKTTAQAMKDPGYRDTVGRLIEEGKITGD